MAAVACTGCCTSLLYAATDASMEIVGTGLPTRFPSLWAWVRCGSRVPVTSAACPVCCVPNVSERSWMRLGMRLGGLPEALTNPPIHGPRPEARLRRAWPHHGVRVRLTSCVYRMHLACRRKLHALAQRTSPIRDPGCPAWRGCLTFGS